MKLSKSLASLIFSGISLIGAITQASHNPDHVNGVIGSIGVVGGNGGQVVGGPNTNGPNNHNNRNERVVLRFQNQIYIGDTNILHLRAELLRQYGIDSREFALESVKLVAKSQFGRGEADLLVGQRSQGRISIGGDPRDFYSEDVYTFDQIDLFNYDQDSIGVWQILLKGNIKVNSVVLSLRRTQLYPQPPFPQPPHPGPHPGQFADFNCSSNKYRYSVCTINGRAVRATVINQISNSPCIQGLSFGILPNGVWVDKGCRANFRLEYSIY
jgi:hypothetical protein